jgi:hypothetical protein
MKRYEGFRLDGRATVTVNGQPLDSRQDLRNHSPDGFEWGYTGSGPAQLALALLADHLGDSVKAIELYQEFKFSVVAGFSRDGWILTTRDIDRALAKLRVSGTTAAPEVSQNGFTASEGFGT